MRDELKKAYTNMLAEGLFTTGQTFKQWSTTENQSIQLQSSHRKERGKTGKNHTLRELESKRLFQHIRKNSEYTQLKRRLEGKQGDAQIFVNNLDKKQKGNGESRGRLGRLLQF